MVRISHCQTNLGQCQAHTAILGTITQWGNVTKESKKDKAKAKVKDATVSTFGDSNASASGRNGFEGGRGRGRGGADRGRSTRGRGAAKTNGTRKENIPLPPVAAQSWDAPVSTDAGAWDAKPATPATGEDSSCGASSTATAAAKVTSSIIPDGVKKSWASMFSAPAPAPKKAPEPVEKYEFPPYIYSTSC